MQKPKKCISKERARELQGDWKNTRAKEIDNAQGYEDTREFWYSLDELQEYLDYVKEESQKQGVKKPGVRIYFGSYPKSNEKKSYATVFLAPTKEASEEELETASNQQNNYEIDPFNLSTGGEPPINY
ncbi:hypothetical protein [Gramella sp. MAR_2010_147]|uniref:hypothetical protein n=1 Tax=Gramella sp. MAR_2010_147 TaxID=1250205 RepID=UPI00087D5A89|nr:hypothetical protein [Gramella sp. MAR_2010_147]SDR67879.1 hypothetical protein SAMN04488553_0237 [Gramella sp. MAR_2010_147]